VVYLYFNYQSKDTQTAIQIARTLLKQLISGVEIPEGVKSLYKKSVEANKDPVMEELISLLQSCSRIFSYRYAVFDALDECCDTQKEDILDLFINLQKLDYKLLISGRPPLDSCHFRNVSTIKILATDHDIETYITRQLEKRGVRPMVRTGCLELIKGVDGM